MLPVVGIDVLNLPLNDTHVHRSALAAHLTGCRPEDTIGIEVITAIARHYQTRARDICRCALTIPVINKADTPERIQSAERLAAAMQTTGFERILITAALSRQPIAKVIAA
jgi:probable selenium-dependent hydroxylase accessory protein YqeC